MDLKGLIQERPPPPKRVGKCDGEFEEHLTEGAVMLAFAMYLFTKPTIRQVNVYPDGLHGIHFDFRRWLDGHGFKRTQPMGTTSYGGIYVQSDGRKLFLQPKSGLGDVTVSEPQCEIVAECKGGIINTRASGQKSKLYRGLCEAVGLLMASSSAGRRIAVVPHTETTQKLAQRLQKRCSDAGIEIGLVGSQGQIIILGDRDDE